MSVISVLPKNVSELIAAGEVVERPASVIKELAENSVDAGATAVTVEIQNGGILYMRVSDNGCGIERDDVRTAFLRHATSKVKTCDDLDSIATLGFRGEALAAVAGVARVELLTCTAGGKTGTRYCISGGEELLLEEAGCAEGTTVIVRDIFYNTPARMKFLKKDITEANAVSAVMERIALSHPEISFKLIRDGKTTVTSPGDGRLESAVYSVLGREFAAGMIPVSGETERIGVNGVIGRPSSCRSNRNGQFFFLNGRFIKSGTITAALEQAYKNTVMVGKFPCAVFNVTVPFDSVDVNVHPTKTEVRFSDERRVFNAVYCAVKNALNAGDIRPQMQIKSAPEPFARMTAEQYKNKAKPRPSGSVQYTGGVTRKNELALNDFIQTVASSVNPAPVSIRSAADASAEKIFQITEMAANSAPPVQQTADIPLDLENRAGPEETVSAQPDSEKQVRYIGEAFKTYIIAECDDGIYFIDKHAAHERINFEELKRTRKIEVQRLLAPMPVTLVGDDYSCIMENTQLIFDAGFEIEDFGNSSVLVCAVPAMLTDCDISGLLSELASALSDNKTAALARIDRIYHTIACKAAIKAGNTNDRYELERLAARVLNDRSIMYCPHGRPVAIRLTGKEIEKQFGRIQ